jgi:DNA-binding NarL/FixJ family response regulator
MDTCLICDDHALVREALVGTVHLRWPSVAISEVGDFPSAWESAKTFPDLCIADLVMPGAEPLEGIAGIMRKAPRTKILVVTGTEDDGLLLELLRLGVAGFAPKTSSGGVIEAAISLILAGGRYLPARVADIAAASVNAPSEQINLPKEQASGPLTIRQIAVLKLVSKGQSNKEIARALGMAPSTVKSHLENVLASLGTANRTEASTKARALGII